MRLGGFGVFIVNDLSIICFFFMHVPK